PRGMLPYRNVGKMPVIAWFRSGSVMRVVRWQWGPKVMGLHGALIIKRPKGTRSSGVAKSHKIVPSGAGFAPRAGGDYVDVSEVLKPDFFGRWSGGRVRHGVGKATEGRTAHPSAWPSFVIVREGGAER